MTLCTPVVGKVTGTIFNQAHPNIVKLLGTPVSCPRLSFVFRRGDVRPGGYAKRNVFHVHVVFRNIGLREWLGKCECNFSCRTEPQTLKSVVLPGPLITLIVHKHQPSFILART